MNGLVWKGPAMEPTVLDLSVSTRTGMWLVAGQMPDCGQWPVATGFTVVIAPDPLAAARLMAQSWKRQDRTLPPLWQVHPMVTDRNCFEPDEFVEERDYCAFQDGFVAVRL